MKFKTTVSIYFKATTHSSLANYPSSSLSFTSFTVILFVAFALPEADNSANFAYFAWYTHTIHPRVVPYLTACERVAGFCVADTLTQRNPLTKCIVQR